MSTPPHSECALVKNKPASFFLTHLVTALAAETTAFFGSSGDTARYNSNAPVVYTKRQRMTNQSAPPHHSMDKEVSWLTQPRTASCSVL